MTNPTIFWFDLPFRCGRMGGGGSLLVVPQNSNEWRNSILQPLTYTVDPPFSEIDAIDALAGLTAVDGATVINDHFELLAFGTKIVRRHGAPRVEHILVTEPIEGSRKEIVDPSQLGNKIGRASCR